MTFLSSLKEFMDHIYDAKKNGGISKTSGEFHNFLSSYREIYNSSSPLLYGAIITGLTMQAFDYFKEQRPQPENVQEE